MNEYMSSKHRFISAVCGGRVDRPPVGSVTSLATTEAMDSCGVAFPDAHWQPEKMAKLAAFCSLEAGFDMIFPVFSVVHEAAALGAKINWGEKDVMPSIEKPLWQEPDDIRIPADFEKRRGMAVVLRAIKILKEKYGDRYAIVGKTFGPWSLGFHLFGVDNILIMTLDNPGRLKRIFLGLLEVTVRSALAQVKAGADVLCLADHCSRDMCSPETYLDFLLLMHKDISRRIPCPLVLHTCGDTSDRIQLFAESTLSCFHYDTRVPARKARALSGGKMSLMGGLSNVGSLLGGDEDLILADIHTAVGSGIDIVGPECAVPLNTPMRSLQLIKELLAHALS